MRLIIHAPGVHVGGGKSLLEGLLRGVSSPCIALLDKRFLAGHPICSPNVSITPVGRSLFDRLAAEYRLRSEVKKGDIVLCFGNLPPLLKSHGRVLVFLQNRYLVTSVGLRGLPARMQCKIWIDRIWLRGRLPNAHCMIVQTPSMAREVDTALGIKSVVLPFFSPLNEAVAHVTRTTRTFLYVASGEPHKNHRRLIGAWRLLARDQLKPKLILSLKREENSVLYEWIIAERSAYGLNLEFRATTGVSELSALYADSDALIFPSLLESLGLPLLEAQSAGMPILASERDYVRDVVLPAETFDPESEVSIARAVKRFLDQPEKTIEPLSPSNFLARLSLL